MRSALLLLSIFGLLFLTGCGKDPTITVSDATGHQVGTVEVNGQNGVVLRGTKTIGSIQSGTILGQDGKRVGSVIQHDKKVLIADGSGRPVGSLEAETKCFGKTSSAIGSINGEVPSSVGAGACYLLLLNR